MIEVSPDRDHETRLKFQHGSVGSTRIEFIQKVLTLNRFSSYDAETDTFYVFWNVRRGHTSGNM
jgi:hypothetical protein